MYTLALECIKDGVIKNYFSAPIEEEGAYQKRFSIFQNIAYPAYVPFSRYQEIMKPLLEQKVFPVLATSSRRRKNWRRQQSRRSCRPRTASTRL